MAKEDDGSISVDVDDLDTVIIEGEPATPEAVVKEAKTPKEPKIKRVSPDDDQQVVVPSGPTPEEALQQAQAFAKREEVARKAAEATAASERAMREQAQREASHAQQTAESERERANNSELAILENGIAAATQQIASYEEEYTRAAESGEFGKMATIQTKLSRAAAALDRLESSKATFDVTARTKTTEGRVEAQPVQQGSAFDRYVSQFAPAAQSWLRQHPDCVPADVGGDSTKNSKMMAGHYLALSQNIQVNTPDYFKVIDEHLSGEQATNTIAPAVASKAAEVVAAEPAARAAPKIAPSAPPTRDVPTGNAAPRSVREVRLTKEQQEMAKVSFPHLTEQQALGQYARNLIELEAEGKLGRVTH